MATVKDKLVEAANRVWKAFMKFGPVDDGRPEGDEFDAALLALRTQQKATKFQTTAERAALVAIVNAADTHPEPGHFAVRDAISKAREVLNNTDLVVEE